MNPHGCPLGNVTAGFLSSNKQDYAMFLSGSKHSTPTGAIVGGVVGGLAILLTAIGLFLLVRKRKRTTHDDPIVVDNTKNATARHSADPTIVANEYYGSPKKGMYILSCYPVRWYDKLTGLEASFLSTSPNPSQRYSATDPNTSSLGGSPFPSGRYTWSDQQTIGDGSIVSDGSHLPVAFGAPHIQGGMQYGWTTSGVGQNGFYEPQELGSTPFYPEMEAENVPRRDG
jgi:hypothetical protein